MLFWKYFFISLLFIFIISISITNNKLLFLFLNTEFLIITIVYFMFFLSIYFNVYWFISFALVYLFLGGLEISMCILIVNL